MRAGFLLLFSLLASLPLRAATLADEAFWRFNFGNDIFFQKDNKLSAGWVVQRHSASLQQWEQLQDMPEFMRRWALHMEPLARPGLIKRAHWAVGQVIQTPTDIARKERIYDDVPYAGALTFQAGWYAFDDREFRGLELTAGVVGPLSLAEQTQTVVHRLLGSDIPQGWEHQLLTEPILNANAMRKLKLLSGGDGFWGWDQTVSVDGSLGNLYTQLSLAVEWRFGENMPGGFLYSPLPPGFGMSHKAILAPANPLRHSLYGSVALRVSAFAWNLFLDGNTYDSEYRVPKEPVVWQAVVGIHYERPEWALHFTLLSSGDDVDVRKLTEAESNEAFGAIVFEWRIP